MDYEYASDEHYGGRVLWGRAAVYGISLLLAFVLGSCVGGRGQVPEEDLIAAQQRISSLTDEVTAYETQIEAMSANAAERPRVPEEGEEGTEGEGADGEADPGSTETRTYTVQDRDTLFDIAQEMYGDGNKFRLIAEANGIDRTTGLRVGQELIIPPDQ